MIHGDTQLKSMDPRVGVGVVATRTIAAGTIVWVRDRLDLRIADAALRQMPGMVATQFMRHAYLDEQDGWTLCWDIARFVNHHCDCNCLLTPWGLEIACRDIAAGEEFSNDYALFRLQPLEEFDCCCGAPECRGHIDSNDTAVHTRLHALKLEAAVARVSKVPQPLWPLLSAEQAGQFDRRLAVHE